MTIYEDAIHKTCKADRHRVKQWQRTEARNEYKQTFWDSFIIIHAHKTHE